MNCPTDEAIKGKEDWSWGVWAGTFNRRAIKSAFFPSDDKSCLTQYKRSCSTFKEYTSFSVISKLSNLDDSKRIRSTDLVPSTESPASKSSILSASTDKVFCVRLFLIGTWISPSVPSVLKIKPKLKESSTRIIAFPIPCSLNSLSCFKCLEHRVEFDNEVLEHLLRFFGLSALMYKLDK